MASENSIVGAGVEQYHTRASSVWPEGFPYHGMDGFTHLRVGSCTAFSSISVLGLECSSHALEIS